MATTSHIERRAFHTGEDARPIEAYPSLRSAAKLVGVTAATLSRREDVERVRAGREQRIPAAEVVRLAGFYRRRPPSRVAAELVERAIRVDPGLEEIIGQEVDTALEQLPVAQIGVRLDAFLETAHRLLPAALARQVEASVHVEHHADSAVGWSPGTE
jgi:hypothetical protein